MESPLVSIVVPAYNCEKYLPQRLSSIFAQTFQDFEVILLDDCSSDRSTSVIARYWNHPKVTHISLNTRNSGSTFRQWQKGIAAAKERYIWIAESDDASDPNFLSTLVPVLEKNPHIGLAFCQSYRMNAKGRVRGTWKSQTDRLDFELFTRDFFMKGIQYIERFMLSMNTIPNASGVVFRRAVYDSVGGVETDIPLCSDWLTWLKILCRSDVFFCAQPLNYFRKRSDSSMFKASIVSRQTRRKVDFAMRRLRYRFQKFLLANHLEQHAIGLANTRLLEALRSRTDEFGADACTLQEPKLHKPIVVVLGMHRSGTSTATRILETMGVSLGDNLIPPSRDNEKGYFEDLDVNGLNNEMLRYVGVEWHTSLIPDAGMIETLSNTRFFQRACDLLRVKANRCAILGIKDPRFSLLLPFWSRVFDCIGLSAKYIIVVREPLAVVQSVLKRDHYPPDHTLWVWMNYTLGSLSVTQAYPRLVVAYQNVLKNAEKEATRISRFLNLPIDQKAMEDFVKKFMDPSLNHADRQADKGKLDIRCLGIADEIYTLLQKKASDQITEEEWNGSFQKWMDLICYVSDLQATLKNRKQPVAIPKKGSIIYLFRAKIGGGVQLLQNILVACKKISLIK